jgi:RNA polymerase sigma factor (sigma-70 family)
MTSAGGRGVDPALERLVAQAIGAAVNTAQMRHLDAGDLVSDATMAVWRTLREYPEGTPISDEISRHVQRRVHGALDTARRRGRKRRKREVLLDDLVDQARPDVRDEGALARGGGVEDLVLASPEDSVLAHEHQVRLDQEVERLAPRDRRLYALRRREGLGWDEIASTLKTPARTLRAHDARIRDHLTAALRAWAREED